MRVIQNAERLSKLENHPHPSPLPAYRERGKERAAEILPKVVDGRDSSSGFFHSVYELNAGDHVAQQRAAVEPSPAPLGLLGEFEDHRQSRLA